MTKRRSSLDTAQLGFTFDAPAPARREADLAGLERFGAALVARALKEDSRPREVIAALMTALLGEDVSRYMLDAYASEAREQHNISFARFLALVAVTERFDLLDAAVRRVGAALLVGEEIHAAQLGHLHAQRSDIDARIKALKGRAAPIGRGASRG